MAEGHKTREQAREMFYSAGFTYDVITPESFRRLRTLINDKMKKSSCLKGTFRCYQRGIIKDTERGKYAGIKCKAFYFHDREAVSFNRDGFIGFAGWADDTNVQPILEGFVAWVNEMKGERKS